MVTRGNWVLNSDICRRDKQPGGGFILFEVLIHPLSRCSYAACKATVDLAFIVDSSGSIGRRRWPQMLKFVKDVISKFNVGPDGTRVAVLAYSTSPKVEFTFNTLSGADITEEEYGKLIDRIRLQRGFTYIDKALKMANEQLFITSAGMRPAVSKV